MKEESTGNSQSAGNEYRFNLTQGHIAALVAAPLRAALVYWLSLLQGALIAGALAVTVFAAINLARERVWVETPYFVPDPPIVMALQTAALRGVDVRLLLPGRSDHPLVLHAGRSFLDELLAAGVQVFELQGTMPHAKTVTVDGIFSTLGSANMDQRSFRLNFEANLFFYGAEIASELERDFLSLCAEAIEVTAVNRQCISQRQWFAEGVGRVLAPLL